MNVFISWSGQRSKDVADALAELLPDAIQEIHPWMSDHDITEGTQPPFCWIRTITAECKQMSSIFVVFTCKT